MCDGRLRVYENRVLSRIFGPNKEEVTREWGKLDFEGLHSLYSLSNIFRIMKSRRMRWAGHIEHMGEKCIQSFGKKT
jgi:hypothetical protein